jgi:hypothetical protein
VSVEGTFAGQAGVTQELPFHVLVVSTTREVLSLAVPPGPVQVKPALQPDEAENDIELAFPATAEK